MSSNGKLESLDGRTFFIGEIVNGKPHGNGFVLDPSGPKYTGNWKEGEFNGEGRVAVYSLGLVFKGKWESHNVGLGTIDFLAGSIYVGEWQGLMMHGNHGVFTYSDGRRNEGSWVGGKLEGEGSM